MSVVFGVSFTQTGTRATRLTACVTTAVSWASWPMWEPICGRSLGGRDRFGPRAAAPPFGPARGAVCEWASPRSLPAPAIMEQTRILSGNARLIFPSRGAHQSRGLSEMSSQFHDECSTVPRRLRIETWPAASARLKVVRAPATLTTGCRPMVLVTTPPTARRKGAEDVVVRFGRRCRREQERVLEAQTGEDDAEVRGHNSSLIGKKRPQALGWSGRPIHF